LLTTSWNTGFYLPEVSHPVAVFDRTGLTVEYVSPKGGKAPMIGIDRSEPLNAAFLDNPEKMVQVERTGRNGRESAKFQGKSCCQRSSGN
jgi:putative intracellular protease/amidase